MTLVSFIVPIYNSEIFLKDCLNSILDQTIKDIQIICINDCSSDNSLSILNSYSTRDSRFEIINFSTNKGPGAARNAGIAKATGKYLRMVDSDDFLPLNSTEKLLKAATQYRSDFIRGGFVKRQSRESSWFKKGGRFPQKPLVNGSIKTNRELWYFDQHTTYLFNSRLVKEQARSKYDEKMRNGEDVAFLLQLVPYMERVSLIPENVYCYRQTPGSTMRGKKNKQYYLNLFKLYEMEYKQLSPLGFGEQVDHFIYYHLTSILPKIVFPSILENLEDNEAIEILESLKNIIDEYGLEKLCFFSQYKWQRNNQLPLLSKQIVLMLSAGYIPEALEILKERGEIEKKNLKLHGKISSLLNSTSWRITGPLRRLINALK